MFSKHLYQIVSTFYPSLKFYLEKADRFYCSFFSPFPRTCYYLQYRDPVSPTASLKLYVYSNLPPVENQYNPVISFLPRPETLPAASIRNASHPSPRRYLSYTSIIFHHCSHINQKTNKYSHTCKHAYT